MTGCFLCLSLRYVVLFLCSDKSITYIDLLPDRKNTLETLTSACENADKFVALLVLNNLGARRDFVGTEEFSAVDLEPRYKSIVNPDA
uniref:hypothetical protein n=1 Tax=Agathobacter sp. TaxID=2021311 RepID=UPI0040563667